MKIKNLNQLKKKIKVGSIITLVDTDIKGHILLNKDREVIKKQSNALKFSGGSWLRWFKASDFTFNDDHTFTRVYPDGGYLKYKVKA